MTQAQTDPSAGRPSGGAAQPRHEPKEDATEKTPPEPASPSSAGAAPEPPPDLAAQLADARQEAAHAHDRFLRAVADLENYRRRALREKEELRIGAGLRIVEDVLPVLDNLGLGLNAARQPKADVTTLVGGVELVLQQLKSALAKHGLVEINPVGRPFNPHEHEAISHQPSADVAAEHVLAVVRNGFTLNGRLVRPASVVVSSGPAPKDKKG
jgi:molecular chaperone GrpE